MPNVIKSFFFVKLIYHNMKPTDDTSNENNIDIRETSPSTSEDKTKLKRILNPFKRLYLKRTKSSESPYNLINSESSFDNHNDNLKFGNLEAHNFSRAQESLLVHSERNPYHSDPNVSYPAARTISQSLIIIPNLNDSSGTTKKIGASQHEIIDDTPLSVIFNPSDLPTLSGVNQPISPRNKEQINFSKHIFPSKFSSTNKQKKYNDKNIKSVNEICNIVPNNFIPDNNNLNINLFLGLKEVLDFTNYLQENEIHLIHLISKYIRNENFQQELLQAVSSHTKMQINNERRAHKIAQEMFKQESEAQKVKERALQNSLDVLVQINRLLEEEIESLKSENEKFIIEYDNVSPSCTYHKKYEEDIIKSNNELRARLKYLLSEIKKLETDLKNLQTQNDCLVNQLANTNSQIRSYKDILQKSAGEHEIEQAVLVQQIASYEQNLKASIDAGDILMEDLEGIKRQLKQMSLTLNWSKFKFRGNTVVDLLHLTRSCINELCRELMNSYVQISLRNKENENKSIEIMKLSQELHQIKANDMGFQSKMEDLNSLEIQLQVQKEKSNILESELDMCKKENSFTTERYYQEKNTVNTLIKDIEDFNRQLSTKDLEISGLNKKIYEIITENSTFKYRIDSMQKLLDDSKLSKVVAELLETQEKCAYYQAHYYQMDVEKNNLIEITKKFDVERANFLKYQQSYNEHLQLQQKDIESLIRENSKLKEQLKLQEEYLLENKSQLIQKIQESNLMKSVQSQFTSEVSKNHLLETNALSKNFEMNRLTVVAEYNNMICHQLKNAIDNKDKIIAELKENIEKLNNAQNKNMEEKAALCQELTKVSYIVKELKKEITNENENVQKLTSEKMNLQKDAGNEIKELHKMITDERQAARELIIDHKNLTIQRNNLLSQQKEYLAEIESLKENKIKLKLLREQYDSNSLKLEENCDIFTKQLHEANKTIELKIQKAKNDAIEYENKLSARDNIIEKMKWEKEELENTVKYLQNNIKKLQTDLDSLRIEEKEHKDQLASNRESLTKFQQHSEQQLKILEQCNAEQKLLEQKLSESLSYNNELLNEYNTFMKNSHIKEEKLNQELRTYKTLNETKSKSIECLALDSIAKLKLLEQKNTEYNSLTEHLKKFEEVQRNLEEKSKLLEHSLNSEHKLNEKIFKLVPENENYQKTIKEYANIINILHSQLDFCTKTRKKEIEICQSFMQELTKDSKTQKQEMLKDLNNLSERLSEMNLKCSEKSVQYENLKSNCKDLVEQLTNTVSTLIEEQRVRQNSEIEIELLKNEMKELKSQLKCADNYIKELKEIKLKVENVSEFGESLQNELEETKKLYSIAEIECKTLKIQLEETTEKLHNIEQLSQMEEGYIMKELVLKSELLQKAENQVEILENRVKKLRQQMKSTSIIIIQLKSEISQLYQKIQILEFQKCELTLRYHELNGKYISEKNLNVALKESHEHLLASVCELRRDLPATQSVSQNKMLTL